MARRIGELEYAVNADTGRLVAQLAKGGRAAGAAGQKAIDDALNDIGGAGLAARLKVVRAQIQGSFEGLNVDIGVDQREVQRGIKAIEARLRTAQLELEITPEFDDSQVKAELAALRLLIRDIEVDINGNVNESELAALQELMDAVFTDISVDVEANLDEKNLLTTKARLMASFKDAGSQAGDAFGGGLSTRAKLIVGAVIALAEPALVGIEGLVASSLAVVGSGVLGIVSGVGALGAGLAGIVNVFAGAAIGFAGFGTALGSINDELAASIEEGRSFNRNAKGIAEALKDLSPSAKDAALAFADVREEIGDSQKVIQEQVFEGLADTIEKLGDKALPSITKGFQVGAISANRFLKELGDIGAETDFVEIFVRLKPAVDNLIDAALALVRTFEPFLIAAAPAAELLSRSLRDSALAMEDFVRRGSQTGSLSEFLVRGVESLIEFGQLLSAASKLLGTIFKAGQTEGDGLIQSLTDVITTFDNFLSSSEKGEKALREFFEGGTAIVKGFQPVLEGLKEAFQVLVTPESINRFGEFSQAIGNALPVIASLFESFSSTGLLTETLGALALAVGVVAIAIEPLADAIGFLSPVLGPVIAGFILYNKVLGPLIRTLGTLVPAVGALFKAIATGTLAAGPAGIAIAGLAVAVGAAALLFTSSKEEARKAAEEVDGFVDALTRVQNGVDNVAVVDEILENLQSQADDTRDAFLDAGVDIGVWAQRYIEGAAEVEDAVIPLLNDLGPVADSVTRALDNGTLSLEEFGNQLTTAGVADTVFPGLKAELDAVGLSLDDVGRAALFVDGQTGSLTKAQEELARRMAENGGVTDTYTVAVDGAADASSRAAIEAQLLSAEQLALGGSTDAATEAIRFSVASFQEYAEAVGAGTERSNAFSEALGLLIEPALNTQAATDALWEQIVALNTAVTESAAGQINYQELQAGITGTALELRGEIRENVGAIFDLGAAMLEEGETAATTATKMLQLRDALEDQLVSLGLTEAEARDYLETLNLTPATILTSFETPGLPGANVSVDNLNTKIGDVKENVKTVFEAPKLPDNLALSDEYRVSLDGLPEAEQTKITIPGMIDAQQRVNTFQTTLDDLPVSESVKIETPQVVTRTGEVDDLIGSIEELDALAPSVTVSLPGITARTSEVDNLRRAIERLTSKTITITTNRVGGGPFPGNMTGNIITSPTITHVGERGLAEAIIPLQLPLSRVNPNVRDMAAMIRNGGSASGTQTTTAAVAGPTTVNNNTFKIVETDRAETTARRVVNRLMAGL